ncbi:MAG: hypothetical protein AUK34_05140 [Ignavibacteria bacterium CG2_30_36_16]|nr:hypothetical protein [Ignavibacteria bacterium]OIP61340.1 MAG: hypothetical protein AUK34_05140 [Ignavibacteria bacterium CG2_30_36_16]PJB01654.1 MAG: hypothetical protein CO127_02695 [Ignavibacteria bacterium CG_4_9_14_3_um_filter_36_18]
MNRKLLFSSILFFIFFTISNYAQQTTEGTFEVSDGKVIIHYNLNASPDYDYEINVKLKRKGNSSFEYVPDDISGDVGEDNFTSGRKTITWVLTESETSKFDGDDFYFEINIKEIKSGGLSWLYYAGAAVLGGGAAALLLLTKKADETTPNSSFPTPPARP